MTNCYRVVFLSIVVALMLAMMPLPDWAQSFRPDWVTMVLIYWVMALPQQVGVTVAWVSGLLLDVSLGSILGQHAIGLVLVSYLVSLQYQRIRVFSLFQQSIVIFILLIFKQILVLWVNGIVGQAAETWSYFLPSLAGAVIWPWVFTLLRNIRRQNTRSSHI
ncbi:MAG: rod shape-determining protein MreD [Gammaproteobacteria bacterium]|nr:rod shape-determining protein MreD [Gammaproteobacteria bacterium]MCW8910160.1 rod shape-determining protein MreD [Gammaproteobacteria bacterium]MCW9006158.1 rod shape-determining protein MreD [Gammaproteobacteria bacterium]MCW9055446.1 rod shape-determining protein MreD [Gammaproteobacteria bacterium]